MDAVMAYPVHFEHGENIVLDEPIVLETWDDLWLLKRNARYVLIPSGQDKDDWEEAMVIRPEEFQTPRIFTGAKKVKSAPRV